MKAYTLLNVLKIAPKFLNMSKIYHNDNEFFSTIYLMNTGGKLEVRAGDGHGIFSTALDCVETDAWKAPVILSLDSIAKAITVLRGLSKKTTCNVAATATGVEITTSAGKSIALENISNAEMVH